MTWFWVTEIGSVSQCPAGSYTVYTKKKKLIVITRSIKRPTVCTTDLRLHGSHGVYISLSPSSAQQPAEHVVDLLPFSNFHGRLIDGALFSDHDARDALRIVEARRPPGLVFPRVLGCFFLWAVRHARAARAPPAPFAPVLCPAHQILPCGMEFPRSPCGTTAAVFKTRST